MGDLGAYNADPLGFMARTAREYGQVVPLRFGPMSAVMVTGPAAIEAVLIGQQRSFRRAAGVRRRFLERTIRTRLSPQGHKA